MRTRQEQIPSLRPTVEGEEWRGRLPYDCHDPEYRRKPCGGSIMETANDEIGRLADQFETAKSDEERAEILRLTQRQAIRLLTAQIYETRVVTTMRKNSAEKNAAREAEMEAEGRKGPAIVDIIEPVRMASTYTCHDRG